MRKHNKTSLHNLIFKMEFSLIKIDFDNGVYFCKN